MSHADQCEGCKSDDKQNKPSILSLRILTNLLIFLAGNDFLEDSPYEPVNSRLSDIFRLAPIIGKKKDSSFGPLISLATRLRSDLVHLQAVHAFREGYLCVYPPLSSTLSAFFSPLVLTPAVLHAGLERDPAWGAIVLSLIKQWINALEIEGWLCCCSRCVFVESTC